MLVLGFDIGGTKLGIGLGDETGKILNSTRFSNKDTDPAVILPKMVSEAARLLQECGYTLRQTAAFGISAPFPADAVKGIMTHPTNNPLWRNVQVLDYLKQQLGIPGCFENDANCGALAEWMFGAGRGCTDCIYLTMSTGIGGGIIAGNKLLRGGTTRCAGELGHICLELDGLPCSCGMKGCYEAYCGGRALAKRMQEALPAHPESMLNELCGHAPEQLDMRLLEQAVRAGDDYACGLWADMARRNAQAMGMFINAFNPQRLILGTFAWAIGDLFMEPIKKQIGEFCWPEMLQVCEIVPSALKREISSYAGIAAALNFLNENK